MHDADARLYSNAKHTGRECSQEKLGEGVTKSRYNTYIVGTVLPVGVKSWTSVLCATSSTRDGEQVHQRTFLHYGTEGSMPAS